MPNVAQPFVPGAVKFLTAPRAPLKCLLEQRRGGLGDAVKVDAAHMPRTPQKGMASSIGSSNDDRGLGFASALSNRAGRCGLRPRGLGRGLGGRLALDAGRQHKRRLARMRALCQLRSCPLVIYGRLGRAFWGR